MKNDPDVVRWSQIKNFLIRFLGWMFVYGLIGWLGDFTRWEKAMLEIKNMNI